MTRGRLATEIDRIVGKHDPDAVGRLRERARGREVTVWASTEGCADVSDRLFATDAAARTGGCTRWRSRCARWTRARSTNAGPMP